MELVSFIMNSEDFPTLLQKTWLISLQTDLYCLKLFIPLLTSKVKISKNIFSFPHLFAQISLQNAWMSNVNTKEPALTPEVVLFATAQKDSQESIVKNVSETTFLNTLIRVCER